MVDTGKDIRPRKTCRQEACTSRQEPAAHVVNNSRSIFSLVPAALVFAFALTFVSYSPAQTSRTAQQADNAHELDKLIDAVASRNKEPRLVKLDGWRYAIFDDKFDWADQKRVQEAVWTISQNESNELLDHLMEHVADGRYSVTCEVEDPLAENWDVGSICRIMAREKLLCAYLQYLEPGKTQPYGGDSMNAVPDDATEFLPGRVQGELHSPPQLHVAEGGDMVVWYKGRKGKPLYELQIEMCEWAIKTVEDARGVAERPKKAFVAAVDKQIGELKKTKKPSVDRSPFASPITAKVYEFFDAKMAREHVEMCVKAQKAATEEKAEK